MQTHFYLQGQPWWLHNNVGNQHVEQLHLTTSLPTTQLAVHSKNVKQQQQNLAQQSTHIVIIHLHWCFKHQGNILSVNLTLLSAPAVSLSGHLDVATYTDRLVAYEQCKQCTYAHGGTISTSYRLDRWLTILGQ